MPDVRTFPHEETRSVVTGPSGKPCGLRITLEGQWSPLELSRFAGEHIREIRRLTRTHCFAHLKPSRLVDASWRLKESKLEKWAFVPNRAHEEDPMSTFWHMDSLDDSSITALLCPKQDGEILPTGFAEIGSVTRAIECTVAATRSRLIQSLFADLTPYLRTGKANAPEVFLNYLYDSLETCDTSKGGTWSRATMMAFLLALKRSMFRETLWHRWKQGDVLLFGSAALHARHPTPRNFKGTGGKLLFRTYEEYS